MMPSPRLPISQFTEAPDFGAVLPLFDTVNEFIDYTNDPFGGLEFIGEESRGLVKQLRFNFGDDVNGKNDVIRFINEHPDPLYAYVFVKHAIRDVEKCLARYESTWNTIDYPHAQIVYDLLRWSGISVVKPRLYALWDTTIEDSTGKPIHLVVVARKDNTGLTSPRCDDLYRRYKANHMKLEEAMSVHFNVKIKDLPAFLRSCDPSDMRFSQLMLTIARDRVRHAQECMSESTNLISSSLCAFLMGFINACRDLAGKRIDVF